MGFFEPDGRGRRLLRRDALITLGTGDAPVVIIHSLTHAVAALSAAAEAGRPVTLASAPGAGIYAGPCWFGALVAAAREAVPAADCRGLLDCGDDAGTVQAAIAAGVEAIVFTGRSDVARRLADIAEQRGTRLVTEPPAAALDLATGFFDGAETLRRRCIDFLSCRRATASN